MKTTAIYQSSATYIRITEDTIFIRERKEKFSWWGPEIFEFNKQFSFNDIEEVEFKQDALPKPMKETALMQSFTIRFKNEKHKVLVASAEQEVNDYLPVTKWVKNESYEEFVNTFVTRLQAYPHIKVYAYTGMNGKIVQQISRFLPSFAVGSLVISSPLLIKILLSVLKIGTGAFTLWGFEYIWTALFATVYGTAFLVNKKKKKKSLLPSISQLPAYFLPSSQAEKV